MIIGYCAPRLDLELDTNQNNKDVVPFSIVTKISLFYFYMPWHFCGSAYIESWNLYRSMPHRAALLRGLWDLTKAFLFSFYLTLHVASDPMWD